MRLANWLSGVRGVRFWSRSVKARRARQIARTQSEVLEGRPLLAPVGGTITVTSLEDNSAADGLITLREAIQAANDNISVDGSESGVGADTIVFADSLFSGGAVTIAAAQTGDTTYGNTAFAITSPITIQVGSSQAGVTLSGEFSKRLFYVSPVGGLTLQNLTLTRGVVFGKNGGNGFGAGGGSGAFGGAIFNDSGTVVIDGSTFTSNFVFAGAGGAGASGLGTAGGGGGGFSSAGGNASGTTPGAAGSPNGGIGGTPSSDDAGDGGFGGGGGGAGLSGTAGSGGFGGGAGSGTGGTAGFGGGTDTDATGNGGGGAGLGGAIFSQGGTLTITNSTFFGNSARGGSQVTDDLSNEPAEIGFGYGGAVFSRNGTLSIASSTFYVNSTATQWGQDDSDPDHTLVARTEGFGNDVFILGDGNGATDGTDTGSSASYELFNNIFFSFGSLSHPDVDAANFGGGSTTGTGNSNLIGAGGEGIAAALILTSSNPNLPSLANNGGPTKTLLPPDTSPVVNVGNDAVVEATTDQRGATRIQGTQVDLGAVETSVVGGGDSTPPTAQSFARLTPATSTTSADSLVFRATFSESVTGVGTEDFAVGGSGTLTTATVTGVSGSGSVYDVTISGGDLATFNGTVGLNFAGGTGPTINDLAGNPLTATEPTTDELYTVSNTAMTYTVDNNSDVSDGNFGAGQLSLREAVELANTDGVDSTINLDDSLAGQTITITDTFLLTEVTGTIAINGPAGGVTLDANGGNYHLDFGIGVTASLSHLTLIGGNDLAGAIANQGTLTLDAMTIRNNTGMWSGGIVNSGTLNVNNSTINNNTGDFSGGLFNSGTLNLTGTTISGNTSKGSGGGILSDGTLSIEGSTITENRSDFDDSGSESGGGLFNDGGAFPLHNSVVTRNFRGSGFGTFDDISGNVAADFAFIGDTAGATITGSDFLTGNALLDILADNGGPTQTHLPLPGSPLIDAGDPDTTGLPANDQRGSPFARAVDFVVSGSVVDIGAVELQSLTLIVNTDADESDDAVNLADLSLREAIELANANPGADTITFNTAGFADSTITLTLGQLVITDDLTITGPGAANLTISGNDLSRIFNVDDGNSDSTASVAISGLTISDGNTGEFDGGAIFNRENLTISDSTLSDNTGADGGAIYNDRGTLTIQNSTLSGNTATSDGGAIYNYATLNIQNSTISGNMATGEGGGIANYAYSGTKSVTIQDSTISGNTANDSGGGAIYNSAYFGTANIEVINSTISGNAATSGDGGAIYNLAFGTGSAANVTVQNSTISGNTAGDDGGAVFNYGNDGAARLTVQNSTISGNTASGADGFGGAIDNFGYSGDTTVSVQNSTISDNRSGSGGGGIYSGGTSYELRVTLDSSTITGNHSDNNDDTTGDGGGIDIADGAFTLRNTIVADNFQGSGTTTESDIAGTLNVTSGFNLIGTGGAGGLTNGTNGNQVGVADPKLGPLADNGGPTLTHALLSGSPAINAGNPDAEGLPEFDQRGDGFPRLIGNAVDIGAFESDVSDVTPPDAPTVGSPATATSVNANNFTITGTAEADSFVQIYSDLNNNGMIDGEDAIVGSQQLTGGATSYSINVALTQDAANNFLITTTDAADNESSPNDVPTITEDSGNPTAAVVEVSPDPRLTAVTDPIAINFGESVTGVDVSDFTLTYNGNPVTLTAAMLTGGGSSYSLDLSTVTGNEGAYELTLKSSGTGIVDGAGNEMTVGATETWTFISVTITTTGNSTTVADTGQVSDDDVILSLDGDNLRINAGGAITEVPISEITNFVFNGGPGDDTLTIDLSGGPLPILITFNGGAGGNDTLHVTNFDDASEGFTGYTINYANPTDGNVQFRDGVVVNNTLVFTGLDPLTIDGTPTDVVFNLPSTADTNVVLSAIDDTNMILTGSTFENTTFSIAAATSITINANAGNDVIEIDSIAANYSGSLIVNGGAGSDRLIVDYADGTSLFEGGLSYNGGVGPKDTLLIRNVGDKFDSLTYRPTTIHNGVFELFNGEEDVTSLLTFAGLGGVSLEGSPDEVFFDLPNTNNSASLTDIAGANKERFNISGLMPLDFDVAGIVTLGMNGNDGNDRLTVSSLDNAFTGRIILSGDDGNDTLNASGAKTSTPRAGQSPLIAPINVRLFGGAGNDKLTGGIGDDTLVGEAGKDTLAGGDGHDGLSGGTEDDNLNGGKGNDTLLGGSGKDVLTGGDGIDVCLGGDGDDNINGGTAPVGQRDTVAGQAGTDRISDPLAEIDEVFTFDFDTLLT